MDRTTSSSKRKIPLPVLILLIFAYLYIALRLLFQWPVGYAIGLAMCAFLGYPQWRALDRYIRRIGKGGAIKAVIGVNSEIALGLLILTLFHFGCDFAEFNLILDLTSICMVSGGFLCGILSIGSLIRRGVDRRLEINWLPATILYVGLCLNVLWGVWLMKPIVDDIRGNQYRARVSAVFADMVTIQAGLQIYAIDHGACPPPMNATGTPLIFSASAPASGLVPFSLTTPVAYLTGIPTDHFGKKAGSLSYRYVTDGSASLLVSVGPDGVLDCPLGDILNIVKSTGKDLRSLSADWDFKPDCRYDPSNGTLSKGDIIRIGP